MCPPTLPASRYFPAAARSFPDADLTQDKARPEPVSPSTSATSAPAASLICQDALQSPISKIDALRGGFSNVVYRVSFANGHETVLFRLPATLATTPSFALVIDVLCAIHFVCIRNRQLSCR
jgi:hypothetical protein